MAEPGTGATSSPTWFASSAARPPTSPSASALLTILFTDVEGSTALHAAKGDTEARRILGACDELIRQQVREHAGREIKSTGDGFLIVFASPRKGVACALAIQEVTRIRDPQVRIRAGLHTGEVSEEAGDVFGGAVNAAARICAKAQGGEVNARRSHAA
jgi:class 3 adenylate cyclase